MATNDIVISGRNIWKRFPGVDALKGVDFDVRRNEILGICGENGAGKSTLMKILSGVHTQDEGVIRLNGEEILFDRPSKSLKNRINTIHQELSYISDLTVAENIFQGRLPMKNGFVDWKRMYSDAEEILKKYDIEINCKATMCSLTMAAKQLIEIVRAISGEAKVVIMDEPTSSLGIDETKKLIQIIKKVRESGVTFIIISHRLEELFELCDRLMIMRDGQIISAFEQEQFNQHDVVAAMIGRELTQLYPKRDIAFGEKVLELEGVSTQKLKKVDLSLHEGEIVGLYGMAGSGQDEILEIAFGVSIPTEGKILLDGVEERINSPKSAIDKGIAYLTAERKNDGLILEHTVEENIVLASISEIIKKGFINYKVSKKIAEKWKDSLDIKTGSIQTKVGTLSGGNQQKVILSKWLQTQPRILLLNEPTRGIDVGSKQEIYSILQDLCEKKMAVVLISSDMMEMLNIADTIYTVCDGRITAKYAKGEATQYKLMLSSIGISEENENGIA